VRGDDWRGRGVECELLGDFPFLGFSPVLGFRQLGRREVPLQKLEKPAQPVGPTLRWLLGGLVRGSLAVFQPFPLARVLGFRHHGPREVPLEKSAQPLGPTLRWLAVSHLGGEAGGEEENRGGARMIGDFLQGDEQGGGRTEGTGWSGREEGRDGL
jgi:hypothetical protein